MPTTQEHIDYCRRQLERVGDSVNALEQPEIALLSAAIRNLADAIEQLTEPAPTNDDDLMNDYRQRRQAWAEYIDRSREATQ